jgi:hypothetical protein
MKLLYKIILGVILLIPNTYNAQTKFVANYMTIAENEITIDECNLSITFNSYDANNDLIDICRNIDNNDVIFQIKRLPYHDLNNCYPGVYLNRNELVKVCRNSESYTITDSVNNTIILYYR